MASVNSKGGSSARTEGRKHRGARSAQGGRKKRLIWVQKRDSACSEGIARTTYQRRFLDEVDVTVF